MLINKTALYPAYVEMAALMINKQRGMVDASHVDKFGEMLASIPEYADIMEPWIVDIHGEGDKENVLSAINDGDFRKFIEQNGSIPASIQKFIEEHGFTITDRGGGGGKWNLGVVCNHSEMTRLCTLLRNKFDKAVRARACYVSVRFTGWKLPGLRTIDDARKCAANLDGFIDNLKILF